MSIQNSKIVPPTPENITKAAEIIKNGGLVAFPTETVYGLGANGLDPDAVRKVYAAKGRPQTNPLILHVSGIKDAYKYADINRTAESLMHNFWPGPLTIVMYSKPTVPMVTRGHLDTVALRVPLSPIALELIRKCALPIAGPSANISGRPSPTTPRAVADDLAAEVEMILDGGPTAVGIESTVVDVTGETVAILRPGGVTRQMLERVVDLYSGSEQELAYRSPGNSLKHYSPNIPVLLWDGSDIEVFAKLSGSRWSYIGITEPPVTCDSKTIFKSLDDYAKRLYDSLRSLEVDSELIVAEMPTDRDIGEALCNRLKRAAGA